MLCLRLSVPVPMTWDYSSCLPLFDTYSWFEAASGSKLNVSKSKGFWLGAWNNRRDLLVQLEWTSEKIKVLGVYVGPGDLEEANWRPRIAAVENVLASWTQRALSFRGRALVIGSLALSRIWYVASFIHMPLWVHADLARFSFWFSDQFHATIDAVLANMSAYYSGLLPPSYRALLSPWREVEGSYSQRCSSFVVGSLSPYHCCPVTEASAKHVYQFLVSESRSPPHCVEKFRPQYGDLCWPSTWSQLFSFNLDRPVIDLSWKVAHGVLYTADHLIGSGYLIDATCFCSTALKTPSHLFFSCPLAQSALSWLQSLMFSTINR